MPGRYRTYGREDDVMKEDLETSFSGFNNRVRPDQLLPGVLAESKNGRLDLNGEWQVRKGINVLNAPFAAGDESFRLPITNEFVINDPASTIGVLPKTITGLSISGTTVTATVTDHKYVLGQEITISGVAPGTLPDLNNQSFTISSVSTNSFEFESADSGTGAYDIAEGSLTELTFRLSDNEISSSYTGTQFLPTGGRSIMDVGQVTGIRAGTSFSNPNVAKEGEYIITCSNVDAIVLNLSTLETFNMIFPEGANTLENSSMLQAFSRIFVFRDGLVALENSKFFDPIQIESIRLGDPGAASTEVTVTTFSNHGLNADDTVEIRNVTSAVEDPNGQFEVTDVTDSSFTYNLGISGDESYSTPSGDHIYPTFTYVASGEFSQPTQLSPDRVDIVDGLATATFPDLVSMNGLKVGQTVTIETEGNPSTFVVGDEFIISARDNTLFTVSWYVQLENATNVSGINMQQQVSVGLGFTHMPMPGFGVYHQRRLIVPFKYSQGTELGATSISSRRINDEIIASDILDSDTYDQIYGLYRFNAGTSDFTVGLHSFSDDKLLVFNRNSIHLVANSENLLTAKAQLLTNEVGCVARESIIQVGNNVLFLSDNGVYGANFQDLYNLRGNEVPLSESIDSTIQMINKDIWDKSSGVYFDNRYYLAVPLNEEIVNVDEEGNVNVSINVANFNNRILVYNFLNKQWESVDNVDNANFEYKQLIVAGDGLTRGVYVISTNGGIHKLDELDQGNDRVIVDVSPDGTDTDDLIITPSTDGVMVSRMFNNGTIDRKKWNNFEMHVQSHIDLKSDFYITGITENVDGTIDLKQLSDYLNNQLLPENEDVSIRGRIGNKRAYGFQFKIDKTTGRPRIRSLKLAAAEAFRSTREAT